MNARFFEFDVPLFPTKESINISKCVNLKFEWKISNFDTNFDSLESPIFTDGKNTMEYRLKLEKTDCNVSQENSIINPFRFPKIQVQDPECAEEISVKIMVFSSDAKKIQSHCKFQILRTKKRNVIRSAFTWCKRFEDSFGKYVECTTLDRQNITSDYVQDNSITISCEINAVIYISIPQSIPKYSLLDECGHIFENNENTDFTFCLSDKEFKVHKVLLAARSPVFRAMFQHDREESKNNRVELPEEVDPKAFRELLRFVYTGKVCNLNEIGVDLFHAAGMYGLENLKLLCVEGLCKNISVENAVKVLMLANLHNLDPLKAVAIGYIAGHAAYVSKTDGWKDMIRSHPELFTEILTHASIQLLQVEDL